MKITIYRNGKAWRTFSADEIDIVTSDSADENEGALFLIKQNGDAGITIDAEITMTAEFGENQVALSQPISV